MIDVIEKNIGELVFEHMRNISTYTSLDDTLIEQTRDLLNCNHISFWGRDSKQNCIYLIREIKSDITIQDSHRFFVLNIGEVSNNVLKEENDLIITNLSNGHDYPEIIKYLFEAKEKHIVIFNIKQSDGHSYFFLISSPNDNINKNETIKTKLIFELYSDTYIRIRKDSAINQLQKILSSRLLKSGLSFLKGACEELKNIFSATTFSLWIIEGNNVTSQFFSEPHESEPYKLGEGLTGNVAKSGTPIFLHKIKDSNKIYNIDWIGKVSEYEVETPNPEDHIMIIPLIYPDKNGTKDSTRGVIRFVSKYTSPSFLAIDFENACEIAKALSVLLYQDSLLSEQEQTTKMHNTLISLMNKANPSNSLDDIFLTFMVEIERWPGLIDWTIIEKKELKHANSKLVSELSGNKYNKCLNVKSNDVVSISDDVHLYPIFVKDNLDSFFVVKLDKSNQNNTYEWLKTVVLIIGYIYSDGMLIQETQELRNENEEKQLQSLTSAVYRLYAHEALNGVKAIESWIKNSKRSSPDYERLTLRTREIHENIVELLESTSFIRLKRKRCILNIELESYLNKLGYKHLRKIGGCEIRLNIKGFKHRQVELDANILIQILNNLILNAREQYEQNNKKGPIEITFIEEYNYEHLWAGFSVKDYAVGIENENLENIFNSGWTTKENGQGLGLWIIKKLIEGSEGKIKVDSTFGHYTNFEIKFPTIY